MRLSRISSIIIAVTIVFACGWIRNYIFKPCSQEPELVPKIVQIKDPINLLNTQVPGPRPYLN